jgi:carbon monoxide dehydrogenase subunit G
MKREVELEYETIGFTRPTSFVCRGRNGRTTATDHLTFTSEGNGTRIQYRAVFEFPFPVNVVAPVLVRRPLEKLADETVEQMTRTLQT